ESHSVSGGIEGFKFFLSSAVEAGFSRGLNARLRRFCETCCTRLTCVCSCFAVFIVNSQPLITIPSYLNCGVKQDFSKLFLPWLFHRRRYGIKLQRKLKIRSACLVGGYGFEFIIMKREKLDSHMPSALRGGQFTTTRWSVVL